MKIHIQIPMVAKRHFSGRFKALGFIIPCLKITAARRCQGSILRVVGFYENCKASA
jgi:hypothetical protein